MGTRNRGTFMSIGSGWVVVRGLHKRLGWLVMLLLAAVHSASGADEPMLTLETGGHTADCRWLDFTPDGRTLVSLGDDKVVRLWDVSDPASPRLDRSFRLQIGPGHEGKLYAGDVSPDGRWLAVGGFRLVRARMAFRSTCWT